MALLKYDVEYRDGEDIFYGYYLSALGYSRTDYLSGATDSATGGTALSSGYKTYNESIGIDADGGDVLLLTEPASTLGKSTAVMSTETKTGVYFIKRKDFKKRKAENKTKNTQICK